MKKLTLALGVAAALTAGSSAMAQQETLDIFGTVPQLCTLAVDDSFAAGFDITDVQYQKVAEIEAWCNNGQQLVDVEYAPQTLDGGLAVFQGPGNNTISWGGEVNPGVGGGPANPIGPGPYVVGQGNGSASDLTIQPNYQGTEQQGAYQTTIEITVMP